MSQNSEEHQEPIETKLAYWLETFEGHLANLKDPQEHLHECIVNINFQNYTKEQKQVAGNFLHTALSLTFLMKNHKENLKSFIKHHTY